MKLFIFYNNSDILNFVVLNICMLRKFDIFTGSIFHFKTAKKTHKNQLNGLVTLLILLINLF